MRWGGQAAWLVRLARGQRCKKLRLAQIWKSPEGDEVLLMTVADQRDIRNAESPVLNGDRAAG